MSVEFNSAPPPLRRVKTPIGLRVKQIVRGPVQVLVWAGTGGLAFWLAGLSEVPNQVPGTVLPVEARLGFARDGTIAEVFVEPGTLVTRGTLLGLLDGTEIDARLAVAERQAAAVASELSAAARRHEVFTAERALEYRLSDTTFSVDELANDTRRFDSLLRMEMEAYDRRLAVIALEGELETERLAAELVTLRLARARNLSDLNVGQLADTEDLELQEQEARREIAALVASLEATRAGAVEYEGRLEEVRQSLGEPTSAPGPARERASLEEAAHAAALADARVIERRLELRLSEVEALRIDLEALERKSTIDGRVTSVEALPGQAVLAGTAVVSVHSQEAEVVVVYLSEPVVRDDDLPPTLPIARASAPRVTAEARVLGFGGGVEILPERLWPKPDRPVFGRTLLVAPPEALRLVPGEIVRAELP